MPNFLSQLAAARSSQQALGGLAGLQLRKTGFEEQRALEDEIRRVEAFEKAELQSHKKREGRRGRGRLVGLLAGAGLAMATGGTSLAIGLAGGLGSAAGQELGARGLGTSKGLGSRKRRLSRIQKGLKAPGLFFSGRRKDIEIMRSDLNKFLGDADRTFDQRILTSAISDAITAGKFGGSEMGKQAGSFLRGETTFKDLFKKGLGSIPGRTDQDIIKDYEHKGDRYLANTLFRDRYNTDEVNRLSLPTFKPSFGDDELFNLLGGK